MQNSNGDDDDPKKSQKRKKLTVKQLVQARSDESNAQKVAAPKSKNHLQQHIDAAARLMGPAGNLQRSHDKKQRNQGIALDEKKNLAFARGDFLTPTKKARDVNKLSRANFAERENETEKKKASNAKRRASADNVPSRKKRKSEDVSPEPVLGINMRRLLLEDFIMLQPRAKVQILVSEDHTTHQETFSKLRPKSAIGLDLDDPSTSMHCYEAAVLKNSQFDGLSSGMWNREEPLNLLTSKGGGAVAFEFPSAGASGIELKWAEFFQNLHTLHVWAVTPNHRNHREVLKPKRKNKDALTQLCNRLCKEAATVSREIAPELPEHPKTENISVLFPTRARSVFLL
jgi:hypothetical protein